MTQTVQQLKLLGDDALRTNNFHSAVQFYEAALSMENGNTEMMFNLAEAYRHLYNYAAAYDNYIRVWNSSWQTYPQSAFWAAMMLKSLGRYVEAATLLKKYLEKQIATDDKLTSAERAQYEIAACDSALRILERPLAIKIRNFSEINTPWSEFNPLPVGDSLFIFSALRPLADVDNPLLATGDYRSQIYYATYGSFGLQKPQPMSVNINGKDLHTANFTITPDGKRAYFNRCSYTNYKLRCDIWLSEKQNNQWTKARKLPPPLNNDRYTTTQPHVVVDPVSGNDLLYFSSDREGGMGGLDLWFCIVERGKPQMPVNLGSIINTPGDEITPFYVPEEQMLYFSSDWHYGLGGFDVFRSSGAMSSWSKPINLGYPVNSGANDFFFSKGNDEAFITSNRAGSLTFREQTCCNDIYIIHNFFAVDSIIAELPDTTVTSVRDDILEILPLSLYFDNDHPDPKSVSPTTALTYEQTWRAYMQRKSLFVEEYSKGLEGFAKYYAIAEMEDFFDNYVQSNFSKLEILAELLYQDLKNGSNVTLKVRGFTSPLTSAEYNILLAKRRIASLVNYFRAWNNGALAAYMDANDSQGARLKIIEEPSGEALAAAWVSDNPHDRRQSVYSKSASLERRIQILIYESDFKQRININENVPAIHIPDNLILLNGYIGKSDVELEVVVNNPGKTMLTITSVVSSSPQLAIISFPQHIEPGKSAIIRVKITGVVRSPMTEHIVIFSDSADERNVVFFSTTGK